MIPHCFNPSLPPFSFLEEGGSGVCLKKCLSSVESPLGNSVSASILNEDERVVEVSCGGEGVLSGSIKGQQWSDLEMGKGVDMGTVDRGWFSEVGKGDVSSRGMELVPNAGLDGGELLVWGRQNEDLFNHLGWIQDETNDRLLVSNDVFNPLVRESEGRWNDADVLTMSCYSLFPLLFEAQEYPIKVLLLLLHSSHMWLGFSSHFSQIAANPRALGQKKGGKLGLKGSSGIVIHNEEFVIGWIGKSYLLGLLVVETWGQFLHPVLFGDRLPFLPLMIVSMYCALGMIYSWIWQLRKIMIKQ
ncbi:hypothetical protein RHGRI_001291 [Rhododendron griersonianum]|uniref:Alpha-1,3-glucosyltransferase n=1 Tax=Rhododendron griersonianum TaxID=479676 RepID=A0AAV6LKW8_9ERIC|nr:hypothetical protein RHGRI_001291 [Rhododendron griersonianum]